MEGLLESEEVYKRDEVQSKWDEMRYAYSLAVHWHRCIGVATKSRRMAGLR